MLINDASITGSLIVNASASFQNISVGGNIIPDETNLRNLGSTDKFFKEIYVSTGSINFVDNGSVVAVLSAADGGGIKIGNVLITTSSIAFIDNSGVVTQNIAASSSMGVTSNYIITGSFNSFTASIASTNTFTSSTTTRLNSLETTSASVDTLNIAQNTRLTNLEIRTGSLATTGSNTFIGTQTITGSLFISANLVVQGTSSLENITASAVSIGTNIVNLNTANPAIRYAGLSIGDSGSIGSSGSFLYDSVQDEFIFVHRGANSTVTSSVLLMGPQTYDSIGNETYLTTNRIPKGAGNEHLVDSNISDTGTLLTLNSPTASFTGSVGIGRTAPEFTLDVNGDIALNRTNKLMFAGGVVGDRSRSHITGDGNNNLFIYGPSNNILATFAYTGTVGIGITNPSQKLEVASGSIKINNTGHGLILPGAIHTSAQINFYNANTAIELMKLPVANNTITFYANTDKLYYHSDKGSVGNFFTLTTDGYIGIGTTSADIRMVVRAVAANTSVMAIRSTTNNNVFNFTSNDTSGQSIFDMGKNTESGTFVGGYIRLRSDGNSWIQGGNLGIRTITPQQPLHVDQGIASVNQGIPATTGTTQNGIIRLTPGQGIYGETLDIGMNVASTYAWLQATNTADLSVKYSLLLNPTGGNIGIGTTNPVVTTDIVGVSSDAIKLRVRNTSTTGNAGLIINPEGTGGVAAGDATIFFDMNSTAWVAGVDKSDSSKFKISNDVYGDFRAGNHFTITTGGDVGIGITNPNSNKLFVYGNLCVQGGSGYGLVKGYDDAYHGMIFRGYPTTATNLTDITATDVMSFYEYGGDFRFFTKNPSSLTMHVRFNLGTIYATNTTVQSVSDIRTKENIRNSYEGLNIISALRPVRFDFKDGHNDNKKNQLGFIAQEVEEVFPDAVSEWEKEPGQIYKTMGPSALIPVLVNAIKELKAEIEILKNK